jgi:hypothetical protein
MSVVDSKKGKLTMSASGALAQELQKLTPPSFFDEELTEISVGHFASATKGAIADGVQHLGHLLDAMIEAGVAADGGSNNELGSVMKMAVLLDGELTLVRRSKRNADLADVNSLERAERRVAVKNLEELQGNLDVHSICSFSNVRIEKNIGGVGISLGNKDNLICGSVSLIKDVEREKLMAPKCFNNFENDIDFEEDEIDPDTSAISRLYGNLTEEVMDDNSADLVGVLVNIAIKVAKSKKKMKLLTKKPVMRKNQNFVLMKEVF